MVTVRVTRGAPRRSGGGSSRTRSGGGAVRVNVVDNSSSSRARKKTLETLKKEQEVEKIAEVSGGLTRTQFQRELRRRGVSVRELRRATREASARMRSGDNIFEEARQETKDFQAKAVVSRQQTRNMTVANMSFADSERLETLKRKQLSPAAPLRVTRNLFLSPLSAREKIIMQGFQKVKNIEAPPVQRQKAQAFMKKVEEKIESLPFIRKKGEPPREDLPKKIRSGFEKGADVILDVSKKLQPEAKMSFAEGKTPFLRREAPFTRSQVKGALSDVLMFGAFTPLIQTATASRQSAYAEVIDPTTGQRRFILKSKVKDFLRARTSTKTQLSFSEKSRRANLLLRNLRNKDKKSINKLSKLLEETYGKGFVREWKLQEGLSVQPRIVPQQTKTLPPTKVKVTPTVQTAKLKGLTGIQTVVRQTQTPKNVLDMKTSPKQRSNQKTKQRQRNILDFSTAQDTTTAQDTSQDTQQKITQKTEQRTFLSFRAPSIQQSTGFIEQGKTGEGVGKTRTPPPPPIIKLKGGLKEKTKKGFVKKKLLGYIPEVKEKGEWIRASKKVHTRAEALRIAKRVADNTTAVTIRAKKTSKKPIKPKSKRKFVPTKFRDYKLVKGKRVSLPKNTFIEKKTHRIDTSGEKRKLTALAFLGKKRSTKKRSRRRII